ncbi:MAG: hypothetical protein ACREJN_21305 [Nitrospiraceae bacterium]
MPISKYFKGHGDEVMKAMDKTYGDKTGKRVFYATANKQGKTQKKSSPRKSASK